MVGIEDIEKHFLCSRFIEDSVDQHARAGAHYRRFDKWIILLKLVGHRLGILQPRGGVPDKLAFLFRALDERAPIGVLGEGREGDDKRKK